MGKRISLSDRQDIMKIWDWEENAKEGLFPEHLSVSSRQVANWICKFGHKYKATVLSKYYGYGCPYCSNNLVLPGFNDFGSKHKDLLAEWDYGKNNVSPFQITEHNGKKYWWLCANGHSWQSRTTDRINGHGCPYCSGRSVIQSINDLNTLNPNLAAEWNYEKNGDLKPNDVTEYSSKKVWWLGKCGHEWQATVKNRSLNGSGCPYCSGTKVIPGENDLSTKYPSLSLEWNYEKNGNIKPINTSCYSNKKVWWLGKCGHEWQDTPGHRVMGRGCPICNKQNRTSFPEQAVYYFVRQQYPDAINGYTDIFPGSMELDVYIPSIKTGIEYDGSAWHNNIKSIEREHKKYNICKEKGIRLIRIKEIERDSDPLYCDDVIYCSDDLNKTILKLADYFYFPISVDVDKKRNDIQESYLMEKAKSSFAKLYPDEAKEWHPTKNGKLRPSMFFPSSHDNVWWLGKCGHEWQMPISERALGNGCPYCSGHRLLIGFNDLATINPQLAAEWHPTKNGTLTPHDVTAHSRTRVWWLGKCGHEWQTKIADRSDSRRIRQCPYCSGKKVLVGFNDLATINPQLSAEWHPTKNGTLTPSNVTAHSAKKVWWRCEKGHEWQARIGHRSNGSGCPFCSGLKRKRIDESQISFI